MFINNCADNKIDLNLYVILYFLKLKSEFEKRKLALFLCAFELHIKTSNKDPPHSFLLTKKKGVNKVKNDYNRYNFWTEKHDGKLEYYMIVENKKVRVPRKAFLVCQNSYRKMLRDSENDKNLYNFADLSKAEKYQINRIAEEERINQWYRKYELNQALNKLNDQEQCIIQEIFFKGHSERELAEKMGLPEKTLNNHKHKILQKLRKIMAEN